MYHSHIGSWKQVLSVLSEVLKSWVTTTTKANIRCPNARLRFLNWKYSWTDSMAVFSNILPGSHSQSPHKEAANQGQPLSLDEVIHQIQSTTNTHGQLNHVLKTQLGPKDVRDTILASTLSNGSDPINELDTKTHTLGLLYILWAIVSGYISFMYWNCLQSCASFNTYICASQLAVHQSLYGRIRHWPSGPRTRSTYVDLYRHV